MGLFPTTGSEDVKLRCQEAFVRGEAQPMVAHRRDKRRGTSSRVEGLLVVASAGCVSGRVPGH